MPLFLLPAVLPDTLQNDFTEGQSCEMPEAELSSDCPDSELVLPFPGCVVRGKSPDLLSLGFLICKMGIMRGPTSLGGGEGDQAEPSATPGQWGC